MVAAPASQCAFPGLLPRLSETTPTRIMPGRRIAVDARTDEVLLDDYVHGDRDAFTELIGRYRNQLLHFLIRFLGSRAAAEDVFQRPPNS